MDSQPVLSFANKDSITETVARAINLLSAIEVHITKCESCQQHLKAIYKKEGPGGNEPPEPDLRTTDGLVNTQVTNQNVHSRDIHN